jgi:biotin synthase-related radical SAM superfamily protein
MDEQQKLRREMLPQPFRSVDNAANTNRPDPEHVLSVYFCALKNATGKT